MTTQFLLTPRAELFDHPSRKRTTYIGPCRVIASDERAARLYATLAFGIASDRPGVPSPWMDRTFVECSVITWEPDAQREGLVIPSEDSGRPHYMAIGPQQGEVWPH